MEIENIVYNFDSVFNLSDKINSDDMQSVLRIGFTIKG